MDPRFEIILAYYNKTNLWHEWDSKERQFTRVVENLVLHTASFCRLAVERYRCPSSPFLGIVRGERCIEWETWTNREGIVYDSTAATCFRCPSGVVTILNWFMLENGRAFALRSKK